MGNPPETDPNRLSGALLRAVLRDKACSLADELTILHPGAGAPPRVCRAHRLVSRPRTPDRTCDVPYYYEVLSVRQLGLRGSAPRGPSC
eukprot:6707175-Prymnesium_polylepis.1